MSKVYPILENGVPVGSAALREEGMFYCFCCRLDTVKNARVFLHSGEQVVDLGLCVSDGRCSSLTKRLSKKAIPEIVYFTTDNNARNQNSELLEVNPEKPFARLADLHWGKLQIADGKYGIVFPDDQKS